MKPLPSSFWPWVSYAAGFSLGLFDAFLMGDHYLVGPAVSPLGLPVLLANFYGFVVLTLTAGADLCRRIVGEPGRRLGSESWPAAVIAACLSLGICGQLYVWTHHVSAGAWGWTPVVAISVLGLLLFAAVLVGLSRPSEAAHRPVLASCLALVVTVGAAFSFARFHTDQDLRLLLFDKIYLTGVAAHLAYVATDLDGDGFAPRWVGGDDPDNLDSEVHALAGVSPWQRDRRATPALPRSLDPDTNVVLLTADSLSASRLGVYGALRDTSPTLDRLARSGAWFRDAIVQWSETSESFASIHSGTYPHTHGVVRTRMPVREDTTLLAERLLEAGFTTAAFVENANLAPVFQFDQGFETYEYLSPGTSAVGPTDWALDWLAELDQERFFVWMHYIDPHGPYEAPPPFLDTFTHTGSRPFRRVLVHPAFRTPSSDLLDYVDRYDEEIAGVDAQVARVVDYLETRGLRENTLVIFTSDHGESFSHNYFASHGRYSYDDLVRVPLLWNLPGTIEPSSFQEQVESVDLVPTLLELLGLRIHEDVEGRSYAARLLGVNEDLPEEETYAFTESGYLSSLNPVWRRQAVRTSRWKYIWSPGINVHELYDLEHDPAEVENVYHPDDETSKRLRGVLLRWLAYSGTRGHQGDPEVEVTPEVRDQLRSLGYTD